MNIAPIRRSVVVTLPPARAFDVFTNDIGRWWPKHMALGSSPVATVVIESRVGGRWFQRAQDGVETNWGDVLAWEPPRRLLLAWRIDASFRHDPALLTEVEVTFTPENGGTRVLLEHRKLEALGGGAERVAGQLDAGWPTPLQHLADYIDAELKALDPLMAEFVVHSIPGSPFGRSVMATLEEKGAAWRLSPVAPGTSRQSSHLERHPFGRVPVLDHGELRLYETQAILRYLDRVLPTPPLTPTDPRSAAMMDLVMGVNDWYLFPGVCNVIVFHRIVSPRVLGGVPDEAAIAAAMPNARTVFDELARLLGDRPFMAGDAVSLADLHTAPQVAMMAMTREWGQLTASNGNLVRWLTRMEARASFVGTTWERVAERAKAA